MKTALIAAAALALALPATGSAARDPRVPALQRQVAALTVRVKEAQQAALFDYNLVTCRTAQQGVVNIDVYNLLATIAGAALYSGTMPDDQGTCAQVGLSFAPPAVRTLGGYEPLFTRLAALSRDLRR